MQPSTQPPCCVPRHSDATTLLWCKVCEPAALCADRKLEEEQRVRRAQGGGTEGRREADTAVEGGGGVSGKDAEDHSDRAAQRENPAKGTSSPITHTHTPRRASQSELSHPLTHPPS